MYKAKSCSENIAKLISVVFSAFFIALISFLCLSMYFNANWGVFLVSIVFSTIFPLVGMIFDLKYIKKSRDVEYSNSSDRGLLFLFCSGSYLLGVLFLILLFAPIWIIILMAAYCVNTFITFLINKRFKISVHAIGFVGPLTILWLALGNIMLFYFVFIIPIAWARRKLKKHTRLQIIAGVVFGIIATMIQAEIYLYLFALI